MLSRFPPMEGGISAKTYWLAHGLAERGHEVHVITHPVSAAREYAIPGQQSMPANEVPGLYVHRPTDDFPWHLPEDEEYPIRLLELAVEIVRRYDIQVIDSGYLVPYGIVGHLVKSTTGVPHVVRHGGSDLEKFLKAGVLSRTLNEALAQADLLITDKANLDFLAAKSSHTLCHAPYVPDEKVFKPHACPSTRHRVACIGKVNYQWQDKGLRHVIEIMTMLPARFECLFVGQGKGMAAFRQAIGTGSASRVKWRSFIPPWRMPGLLQELDAIFAFEGFLPHPVFSNLVAEALAMGTGLITDRQDLAENYRDIVEVDEAQILTVCPTDHRDASGRVVEWMQELLPKIRPPHKLAVYQEYLSAVETAYGQLPSV